MTLRVSHVRRSVIVTLPPQCPDEAAGSFVELHKDWVRARLGALPRAIGFRDGAGIPLRGILHQIVFPGIERGAEVVRIEPAASVDHVPCIRVTGPVQHCPRRLKDWLVASARRDLDGRVAFHARNLGLRPRRITVRDQTTRWGSCSSTGALSFSWRLIFAPPIVLDYVAAHEVAHLAEMNHGPRFWELVRITMPRMDEAREWLRRRGQELHAYGAGI